jgi:hypothetical protein
MTNFAEMSDSWENIQKFLGSNKIPSILLTPEVQYRVCRRPNPVYTFLFSFFEIHFNVILPPSSVKILSSVPYLYTD